MSIPVSYPARLNFSADYHMARWRPLVNWLLAIPQLLVAGALGYLRSALTLVSLITVLFTEEIPRPVFDAMAMCYRYEWRAVSYALFLHEDYPPFDFATSAGDDRMEPHTAVDFDYPEQLNRWAPLYKWFLAVPHYFVLLALWIGAVGVLVFGVIAVLVSAEYPHGARDYLVDVYRYGLRVQAYVGLLTDRYPPFTLGA